MSNITEVSKPTQWKSGRRPQKHVIGGITAIIGMVVVGTVFARTSSRGRNPETSPITNAISAGYHAGEWPFFLAHSMASCRVFEGGEGVISVIFDDVILDMTAFGLPLPPCLNENGCHFCPHSLSGQVAGPLLVGELPPGGLPLVLSFVHLGQKRRELSAEFRWRLPFFLELLPDGFLYRSLQA